MHQRARCPYICCSNRNSQLLQLVTSGTVNKCVSNIMRLIRRAVKRWVIKTGESERACGWNRLGNAEFSCENGCGQKEQFVRTADCIMLLRWFGAHLMTALHVNCISIVPVCVHVCVCDHHLWLPVTLCKELVPVEAWGGTVEADSG